MPTLEDPQGLHCTESFLLRVEVRPVLSQVQGQSILSDKSFCLVKWDEA